MAPSEKEESKAQRRWTKRPAARKVKEAGLAYFIEGRRAVSEVAVTKLSSKRQITLPAAMVRRLGLEPGDTLAVALEDDKIVLRPRPRDWVKYYRGRLRGVYGSSVEEIDEYVRRERESWRRRAEQLDS